MSLLASTHANALQKRRGIAKFGKVNADGSKQSLLPLSPSAELTFSMSSESSSYTSQESAAGEILDTTLDQIDRTFEITCNRMHKDVLAMFVVGNLTDLSQASGSVTGEETAHVFADRSVQLGGSTNNYAGIFGITALTAEFFEGANAATRADSTAYAVGDVYVPATPNSHFYMCTVAGTSDASPPTFSTTGATFADGTATFVDLGLIAIANVADADFEADLDYAVINIPSTGAIADAISRVPAAIRATGKSLRLEVAYTRSAKTVQQVATGGDVDLSGEFWFYTANSKGGNEVWRCPSVTIVPNGDFALKSGEDYGSMTFSITAQKPPTLEAIYINGVPAG